MYIAPYVMIPLAIIGPMFLNCRYHISGWGSGEETVNRAMDEVTDTVNKLATPIRKRVKQEIKVMKGELHQKRRDQQARREAEEKKE